MEHIERLAREHVELTRRYFMKLGAGLGLAGFPLVWSSEDTQGRLAEAVDKLEYITHDQDFTNYGRGNPPPHTLPPDKLRAAGLVPDTWQLEVVPDPESDAEVEQPLSKALGTALDWNGLMTLAKTRAVRFMSVMSCTNGHSPCGMGVWEGVPLRDVIWLARPKGNIRRVFYYGYHNDDPAQRFQSSLPIGRVLEDPPDEHPVILCYKLNDQWLSSKRGGPARIIVPEAYGNKAVKWLQRVVLTNNPQANDTYAEWNNDTVSHIKTCARFVHVPEQVRAGQSVPITGVAQVGMSGLEQVQFWPCPRSVTLPGDDPYFTQAPWQQARILPPPAHWGTALPQGKLPALPHQINPRTGKPLRWPLANTVVHWAAVMKIDQAGPYDLRCRTIDRNGQAQPMPRPFLKSGYNAIQLRKIDVF